MTRTLFIPWVCLILVFAMAARTPLDSDLWWHLRAGETTLQAGKPLTVDSFSYTRYGMPWVNHSWLAQVILYLCFHWGGFLTLGALVALLATISMGFTFAQMDGPSLLRAFVLVFAAPVTALVWSARPQLFSLVLFAITGYLLTLYKWQKVDRLFLLAPLFILWSNLHGGYVLGILLICAMIAGEALNHLLGTTADEVLSWRQITRLVVWGAAAGLAVLINPNGLNMWAIPFRTVGVEVLQAFIAEWASPDFHELVQQPFLWLLLATFAAVGLSGKRLDGTDLIGIAGFAYLGFLARRNFGPFALVAAPVLTRHLWAGIQAWRQRAGGWFEPREIGKPDPTSQGLYRLFRRENQKAGAGSAQRRVRVTNPLLNLAILCVLAGAALLKLCIVTTPQLVDQYIADLYPVAALRWVADQGPAGRMFNSYNWGGFMIWELRNYPVFVDGRTDLYDDVLLRRYLRIINGEAGWETELDEFDVHFIFIEKDNDLVNELEQSNAWKLAYKDDQAVIYLRQP